jgi:localization factor PodJL
MATSLPWSVKGVDPRTRDAAKAAARRAGMTLGEWLDHKIREEAAEDDAAPPEQLDIAALSERLAKLSQGQMETSSQASASRTPPTSLSRDDLEAVIDQAASVERLTRESSAKTAGALDSIARWIEKTESRISDGERAAAERQERATTVIADAIKTMGERIVDIERKNTDALRAPARATAAAGPRLAFSRDGLAAAVDDIRTRQRALDAEREPQPTRAQAMPESRIAALRQDLRDLSARIAPAPQESYARPMPAAAREPERNGLDGLFATLNARLDRIDRQDRLDPLTKPLARIESEIARLSQEHSGESYQRFELEIAHLAAKVDALAARGGDRGMLSPVLRDIGELRELLANQHGDRRLDEVSQQLSSLSRDLGQMREQQPDGREMRSLALAIEDVRDAILSDRSHDRHGDPAAFSALSRQIDSLAAKIETLPAMRPDVINAQAEQLASRLSEIDSTGRGASDALSNRIEALVIKLEDMAAGQPRQLDDRIDALQQRIELLAEQGPTGLSRQIDALAGRIESLAASSSLSQLVNEGKSPGGKNVQVARVDLGPVEEMLRSLADKIDVAGRPGADSQAFDALEQQISGIAQRLDAAAATRSAETGIERTLQDLVGHLQNLRQETSQAAERAARTVMADLGGKSAAGPGIAEISGLLSGLRDSHISSGRETQDAIGAVHQTLETVISRLASIEADIASERQGQGHVQPAAPRPEPRPMPAAKPLEMPAGLSIALEDRIASERGRQNQPESAAPGSLDLPLEPGSGRPRAPAAAAAATDPQSVRQNLIAAARRSAKAATEAASATPAATATAETPKSGGRLKEIMEKRRRPLLLGLAALVLAMGTAHVVTGALQGEKPKTTDKAAVETPAVTAPPAAQAPAAPPAPAPAAPAKPAKDQSSALPPNPLTSTSPTIANAPAGLIAPRQEQLSVDAAAPVSGPVTVASLPPAEGVQPVTGLGDLPPTLGSAGLRKAALAGDARAVYELASRAADGPATARDPKLALRLFERAAVAGLPPAQFRLGNMFEKGVGAPRDPALARVWYVRAAERGNAKAMHNLAVLYAEGVNGKPDYAGATEWFRKAAELGVRDSQYNLAILLGRGLGAPTDLKQSYVWFAVAAGQGDEDAGKKRDDVAQRMNAEDLAAAKSAAEGWKPKALEASANDVAQPPKGWDETPSAAAKKPAKPVRG